MKPASCQKSLFKKATNLCTLIINLQLGELQNVILKNSSFWCYQPWNLWNSHSLFNYLMTENKKRKQNTNFPHWHKFYNRNKRRFLCGVFLTVLLYEMITISPFHVMRQLLSGMTRRDWSGLMRRQGEFYWKEIPEISFRVQPTWH